VSGLRRAFVGRDAELEILVATYRRVASERRAHLVTLMGDAGVGKTRLVRELWERLGAESPEPVRRTGRCLPYGHGITYWPLGEILKEEVGLLENDLPETTRAKLGAREILGLSLGLDVGGDIHPLAARDRLHDAWVEFLQELAEDRPAVVLIEDVHWAEEPLLDLLDRLAREVQGSLLLLATARPELLDSRPSWAGGRRNSTIIGLEPLSADDAAQLLEELLASGLPNSIREAVVGRAEGNPFFVEELVGALIDQGVLRREDGRWIAGELPPGYAIPDSVQAVLASRIDLLGDLDKAALQAAAVIGRVFWPAPVRDLLGVAEEPDFDALEERDFIRRRAGSSLPGEREFAFKHALTREVAYAGLPKARRARLHAAFAAWLERVGEGKDEWAALLAHHYVEAVRPEDADLAWAGAEDELLELRRRTVAALRRAAKLAVGRYEIDEGLALLERALELTPDDAEQVDILRAVGRATALKFDGEAFLAAMQDAVSRTQDPRVLADLYADLAYESAGRAGMWQRMPDPELVGGWIARALELTEPDTAGKAKALVAKVWWDPKDAGEAARDAARIAERLGDPELRADGWDARATAAFAAGRFHEAAEWAERPLDLLDEIDDPGFRAGIYSGPIPPYLARGRLDDARRMTLLHDDAIASLTPHHRVHGVALRLEVEELTAGWEAIRELASRTKEAVAGNLGTPCVRNPRSLYLCALAAASLEDETEAARLEGEADSLQMEGYLQLLGPPRIRLALLRGDLGAVERILADLDPPDLEGWWSLSYGATWLDAFAELESRAAVEETAPRIGLPGSYLEPFALRALGRVREDGELLEQAAERFETLGLERHAAETRARLG
jgi:hypothetical protein